MSSKREYAIYRGDTFLDIGTKKELAEKFNVSEDTITFWHSPSNLKRINSRSYHYNGGMIVIDV